MCLCDTLLRSNLAKLVMLFSYVSFVSLFFFVHTELYDVVDDSGSRRLVFNSIWLIKCRQCAAVLLLIKMHLVMI